MIKYQVKNFNNRKALEEAILADQEKTTNRKDAQVSGTILQLKELMLEHGQNIWGVPVVATNYQVNNNPRVKRGNKTRSKVNGQNI